MATGFLIRPNDGCPIHRINKPWLESARFFVITHDEKSSQGDKNYFETSTSADQT